MPEPALLEPKETAHPEHRYILIVSDDTAWTGHATQELEMSIAPVSVSIAANAHGASELIMQRSIAFDKYIVGDNPQFRETLRFLARFTRGNRDIMAISNLDDRIWNAYDIGFENLYFREPLEEHPKAFPESRMYTDLQHMLRGRP